jgi:hypothetical protein
MNIDIALGISIGLFIGSLLGHWALSSYKRVLVMKAEDQTCEYLDGNFYYVVPEKRLVDLELNYLKENK